MNEADGSENLATRILPARKITPVRKPRPVNARMRARPVKPVIRFARVLTRAKYPARSSPLTDIRRSVRVCVCVCVCVHVDARRENSFVEN